MERKREPTARMSVLIERGAHSATVRLAQFDSWVIEAIERPGLPPITVDDMFFERHEQAIAHAREIWLGTLA